MDHSAALPSFTDSSVEPSYSGVAGDVEETMNTTDYLLALMMLIPTCVLLGAAVLTLTVL